MIKQKSIEEVLETARVEDVVEDFVSLKRRGVNMIGLCPFHNEKTPSFTVSPSKGIYKCFGCGAGGDALKFVMEHESLTFPEGIRYLAKKYGIQLEEQELSQEARQERQYEESLYLVNQFAKEFYQDQLFQTDRGKSVGLSYFKRRGFREETIRKFGLGYAPAGKDTFTLAAVQKGYDSGLLKKLGLTSQYGRDFFRDRVMFAVHSLSGKVIGFGGRILAKDAKAPKYVNTPETDIYNKRKVLYGAYFAKRAIRKSDECILVEGYTDVLSLHQAGIENVVSSSGTSLTVEQIQLIKRNTEHIKILYDGDKAGVKAALRGIGLVLEQGLNVKIVLLPEGEDPDSYLQSVGTDAFKEYIDQQASDFIMFQANLLKDEAAGDPIKLSNLIKEIVNSIARIPDPLKRSLYVRECARIMGVEEQLLVSEANKAVQQHTRAKAKERQREQRRQERQQQGGEEVAPFPEEEPPGLREGPLQHEPPLPGKSAPSQASSGDAFQERDIVRILINGGAATFDKEEELTVADYIIGNVKDVLEDFDNPLYKKVLQLAAEQIADGRALEPSFFLHHPDEAVQQLAIDLSSTPYEYSENWEKRWDIFLTTQQMPEKNFAKDSASALKRFRLRKLSRMINKNAEKIKEFSASGSEEYLLHLKLHQRLKAVHDELAKELGTVVL